MFGFGGSKTVIGLDIGSHSIKLVSLKKASGEPQLLNFGIANLPHEGAVVEGQIRDQQAVTDVIKEFLKASKIKPQNVVVGVSTSPNIPIKFIKVPMMADAELDNAIQYEAETQLPFKLSDMNISYHKLSSIEEEGGMSQNVVLLVAAPKEMVTTTLATLKSAAITPIVFDISSLAILNALEKSIRPEEVTAIVDLGAAFTTINIVKEGVLKFCRTVLTGGNNITSVISNVCKLDFAQADELKLEQAMVPVDESAESNDVTDVVRAIVEELTSDIRRSFDYYKAQFREPTIHRILLAGGTAKLRNINQFLENELGIDVEVGNPLTGITANLPNMDQFEAHMPELTAAMGLALREVVN